MTSPRASIIITTHERPDKLRRAVESAFAAGREAEVIVVDDASSDKTADVCSSIDGIKYVRVERNQGVAGARNVGLIASRGQFITFLDDDDLRLPHSLDAQIEALGKCPEAMLCYAPAVPQDAGGQEHPPFPDVLAQGDIFWQLLRHNFIPCGSVVFRRDCLAPVGLLDDSLTRIDDWDLWLRITERFPAIALETPVLVWRQPSLRSMQGSSDTLEVIDLSIRHFHRSCFRLRRLADASRQQRQHAWRVFSTNLADHLAWETFRGLCTGQLRRSFTSATALLRLHPGALVQLLSKWTRPATIKTLLSNSLVGGNLDQAKIHFKEIRSIPDNR